MCDPSKDPDGGIIMSTNYMKRVVFNDRIRIYGYDVTPRMCDERIAQRNGNPLQELWERSGVESGGNRSIFETTPPIVNTTYDFL